MDVVKRKTLTSIVTPSARGARKIVVSGPDALSLVSKVFKCKKGYGLCKAEKR